MPDKIKQAFSILRRALCDTSIPKTEYRDALEEIVEELQVDLDAVIEEIKADERD